ncbi:MAG: DUF1801 domain-containing protein [Phycisphaerales bacterium]|nr:DUF1801 domain-containing protein [Phycisphaerales bacterium]
MGKVAPATPKDYLDALPEDRRKALARLRTTIRKHLPKGYKEGIQYGMIGYFVPHSIYPDGYHTDPSEPVPFASIASQKNHMALYLFCLYTDKRESARFEKAWKASGCKLDMGKSCVRFKSIEDVPLDVVGETISRIPVADFIKAYEAGRPKRR